MKLFLTLLFTGLTVALSAQAVCRIDASNANQDFCTACSSGTNPALVNGVFTGTLEIYTSYTISADCLAGITFAETFNIWVDRYANLTFGQDPIIADGTTASATHAHHVHSGYIWVFGVQYTPRGNNGTSYDDLSALMTSPENNRSTIPGPAPAPGGGGEAMLPISLLDWEASPRGDGVEVRWSTTQEVNNDFFIVEYSRDGANFTPLAQLSGAGSHRGKLIYSYQHTTPAVGTNFYRLTQYDLDGTATTYPVVTAEVAGVAAVTGLHPNPASPGQAVRFPAPTSATVASLFHLDGRLVASTPVSADVYAGELPLPATLPSGVYVLRVGNHSEKLLVR